MLDDLDQILIKELEKNARESVQILAKKLGIKRSTVYYRLDRLMGKGILKIACVPDFQLFGYLVSIGIKVSQGKIPAVTDQLALISNFRYISRVVNRYDIWAYARFSDQWEFEHILLENISKISDIIAIDVMHVYQWIVISNGIFNRQMEPSDKNLWNDISDLDFSIIKAMEQDPRQPIAKLAKTVGCRKSEAKISLDRLLKDKIIRLYSFIELNPQQKDIAVLIFIRTKPDKVDTVANELSAQNESCHVLMITERWQILLAARFRDIKHMYDFLSERLDNISGIIEREVIHFVKALKSFQGFFS